MKFTTGLQTYEDGGYRITDFELLLDFINKHPGKYFELTVQRKRSVKQNRVYWMYVNELSKHTGFTSNEMHEVLKFKFLKAEKYDVETGEVFEYIRSTTDLSTKEFTDFIEQIRVWSIDNLNVHLPLPNEQINLF